MRSPDPVRPNSYALLGAFLLLSLGIGTVGYRHYMDQRSGIEAQVRDQLAAIADLKVRQVAAWRRERMADASVIAATQLMPATHDVLAGSEDAKARAQVLASMETIRRVSGYANVILVDLHGEVRLSVGRAGGAKRHYLTLARGVVESGEIFFSDLHYDSGLSGPHLGLSIPLRSTPRAPPEGALLLGIDPNEFLYPLIRSWPVPSRTAETLLVRREGDHVVYLNDLRHRQGTALELRAPLSDLRLPAARAVLGQEGVREGIDYRGVRVLAATRRVPDSPWALVAKVDAAEIYVPIREQTLWLALILSAITLATATGVGLVWQRTRSRFYQQKYEAELEQRRSRALLNSVMEATSDAVYVKDREGRYLLANSALCQMAGLPLDQVLGRDDTAVFSPQVAKNLMERERAVMTGGKLQTAEDELTLKSGERAAYLTAEGPLLDDRGNVIGLFGIARDITDRKRSEEERARLQEQLQQAQKMESIGRLAGGIAHDFNNLLTVMSGYASLVLGGLREGDSLRAPVAEIGKAGERAASLTQQLLAFSRKQVIEPKLIDLNEVVQDASILLARLVGDNIEVVTHLAPSLGCVLADPSQLHQVLLNLAVNARDAMPGGGKLIIETEHVEIDEDYVAAHTDTKAGRYVLLTVADTGVGMDEATRQRAFEPFFTTKPKGEGTGLGLSTVYGIVKQSGGWIWMYSEPRNGSTFRVYLPEVASPAKPERAVTPVKSLHGTETALVVEDLAAVRKLTAEILRRYGYDVLEVASGEEALLLLDRFSGPVHVMITDVVLPGMTGRELATRLAPLRSEMKVLYISGYAGDVLSHQGILEPGVTFLPKPFTPDALARKLRELLDAAQA